MSQPFATPAPAAAAAAGLQRSAGGAAGESWLAAMADEIDVPMLLVGEGGVLLHANRSARTELDEAHPLRCDQGRLVARRRDDQALLVDAVQAAIRRGLRRMVTLAPRAAAGAGAGFVVAVVPLLALGPRESRAALVLFGRRHVCQPLSLQWFATMHKLSIGETQVVGALCEGLRPGEIAARHRVAVSTVRAQIGHARTKTGTASIRDLVQQVAALPPLLSVLWTPAPAPN